MEPCLTLNCLLNRIRGNSAPVPTAAIFIATDDVTSPEPPLDASSFKILLPVLLIGGLLVIVAIGLIMHRLVIKIVRKRWRSRDSNAEPSGAAVATVSGDVESPPSYRHVLATLENEELPPSYYQVMNGVVNLGFDRNEGQVQTDNDITTTSSNLAPNLVQTLTRSSRVMPSDSDVTDAVTSSVVEENIDDVIDSISVPSRLSESISRRSSTRVNSTKNNNGLLRHNGPKSNDSVAPKDHPRDVAVVSNDVIAHVTPV